MTTWQLAIAISAGVLFLSLLAYLIYLRHLLHKKEKLLLDALYRVRNDQLTDALNRYGLNEHLKAEVERAIRNSTHTFSLIMVDVDFFKKVNDQYGHLCGDFVLIELARLFRMNVRVYDLVCRWGGEEFLMLLPLANLADAAALAERLRKKVEQHVFNWRQTPVQITVSAGVQEYQREKSIESLLASTDQKLYRAKNAGRNVVISE